MLERGVKVDHTTIYHYVQAHSPELDKRCRRHLKSTKESSRVDEMYIKVKGIWKYLYRAVDSEGKTLDFMLGAKLDSKAARRFFQKSTQCLTHNCAESSHGSIRTQFIHLRSQS
ncbi:MAG: DDE-type integrase/transposase/recombinase [Cyanobacteria bacterium J06614_10]